MTLPQADDSFDPLEPDEALDAREYLRVLWHAKWRILGLAVLMSIVLGAVGVVLVNPRFRTSATVNMDPVALEQLLDTTGEPRDLQADLAEELNVADNPELEAEVKSQLGFTFDGAARVTEGSSSSLDIEASADSAANAQRALDAMVAAFIAQRNELGVAQVDQEISPIQDQIAELQAGRDEASAPLDAVISQLNNNPDPADRAALLDQQLNLQNQLGQTLDEFDNQIARAQSTIQSLQNVQESIQRGDHSAVGGIATVQTTPGGTRLAAIGFVLGLLLGMVLTVGRRALDKSIRSKAALEYATGHRVLGLIPRVVDWDEDEVQNVSLEHPTSPPAEAYRTLRTSLHFLTDDRAARRILFTSASAGEGKTTTVANLAVSIARTGRRVLVVDADLRKPRLHEFFGLPGEVGLADALAGEPVDGFVRPVPGLDSLSVLAAGPVLAEPSEHLESERTPVVLAELDELADLVLFDAPPVLPVTDALVLARHVDAVILVAAAGATKPKEAGRAAELLDQLGAPLVGSVLNDISREMGDGYAFEYGYELETDRRSSTATPAGDDPTGTTGDGDTADDRTGDGADDEPVDDQAPVS